MTAAGLIILFAPLQQPVAIFLTVLAIILVTPLIFNRLKIPYIVGMIIAGMAVGPYGFDLLERDASFQIFGEVGILYLMFLAGVEIDMFHLRQNMKRGIIFGLITFAIPMCFGLLSARLLMGCGWLTAVLIASMFASHTLISYPIISRFGLTNKRSAVISVCGTIVAVLLALIALAEVADIKTHGRMDALSVAWLLGRTIVFAAIYGITVPWLTKWFFRNYNESVSQFIYVLCMVFCGSMAAQAIGLEGILGAFYSGLILNRFIPQRSALMGRIEFVGNAIFIPYFLIGVGMLLNVSAIVSSTTVLWMAVAMTVPALAGKWLAAFIAQKLWRMTGTGRRLMFGLTSGKAAATIAATMVGFHYGILDADIMNAAVVMILVCCTVASLVTERASKELRIRLAEETLQAESCNATNNARQLVAVANPITAESLMKLLILMRPAECTHPITALFVRNTDDERRSATGKQALDTAVRAATAVDIRVDEVERYDMNVVAGMVNVLKERHCSDMMIGLHRRSNIVDSFFGSMTEQLLSQTNRMVMMSRVFVPVNTLGRIVVIVPRKGEYETGFSMWVDRVCRLGSQLSCEVVFMTYGDTIPYLKGAIRNGRYQVRHRFSEMESWDDFITLSGHIRQDDLMVVIGARRTSISFNQDLEALPLFLSKYFSQHNLLIIYPEQFGEEASMPPAIDSLSQAISSSPTPALLWTGRWSRLRRKRKNDKRTDL